MRFNLFDYLDWKIPVSLGETHEKYFCDNLQQLFSYYGFLSKYNDSSTPFALIKKSIVLAALNAKRQIEYEAELYSDAELAREDRLNLIHNRLPSFKFEEVNVFVPFFSAVFNKRYDTKVEALTKYPFLALKNDFESEIVDPFETYGLDLFNSTFTRLIFIKKDRSCAAFYHAEMRCLFIINIQGGLDQMIPLFDSDIIDPDFDCFFTRLERVIDAYLAYDRRAFIESLFREGFISKHLYLDIEKQSKRNRRKRVKRKLKAKI